MDVRDTRRNLILPAALEPRRDDFVADILGAANVVEDFASRHGWHNCLGERFFATAEIHERQETLWERAKNLEGLPGDAELPTDGLAACIVSDVLLAVPPEAYAALRPEYATGDRPWMRLLAHEMVHVLHLRILDGDASAMGPRWFYEGFALHAAGQRIDSELDPIVNVDAALAATEARGRGSYAAYLAAFRYVRAHHGLAELLQRAGEPGFETWLFGQGAAE